MQAVAGFVSVCKVFWLATCASLVTTLCEKGHGRRRRQKCCHLLKKALVAAECEQGRAVLGP